MNRWTLVVLIVIFALLAALLLGACDLLGHVGNIDCPGATPNSGGC